jgi:hypothetical protein
MFPVLTGLSGLNIKKPASDPGVQPRRLDFTPGHHLISPSGLKSARLSLFRQFHVPESSSIFSHFAHKTGSH